MFRQVPRGCNCLRVVILGSSKGCCSERYNANQYSFNSTLVGCCGLKKHSVVFIRRNMGNMCVAQWGCQEVRHPIYLKHTANKSACFLHRASSTRFNLSSGYCSAVLSTSSFHWSVAPIGQLESVSCTIMGVLIFTKSIKQSVLLLFIHSLIH